jgi:hypothetical protein
MSSSDVQEDQSSLRVFRLLAFISLFLVLLIQLSLYLIPATGMLVVPRTIWFGLFLLAGLLLLVVIKPKFLFERLSAHLKFTNRSIAITFSIGFAILAILGSIFFEYDTRAIYIPISTFWLLSGICFTGAFSPREYSPKEIIDFIKAHKKEAIIVSAITLLGLGLRMYRLGKLPIVINGDEGWLAMTAIGSDSGNLANPFALWENFGGIYIHGIRDAIRVFGHTGFALRLLPALGGALAIPTIYLLAREIAGKHAGFFSAFLLACSHAHLNYSRTAAVAYIQGTWLIPLELFFLLRGLRKKNYFFSALSGAFLAIHFCIYLSAQVIAALIVVFIVLLAIFKTKYFREIKRHFIVWGSSFILMLLPEMFYIWQHPNQFFTRLNSSGTFQTGWLASEMVSRGHSAFTILSTRVAHAFLTLIYYPSNDFYGTSAPVLTYFTAVLFLIGLVMSLYRTRQIPYMLLNGYFWAMTLSIGIFALPESADSYRMLSVLPAAVIMAAIGLLQVLKIIGLSWPKDKLKYSLVVGATLLSIFGSNFWIYFMDFAGECKYGNDIPTRYATYMGYYLDSIGRGQDIYLLGDSEIFYGQNKSIDFLSGSIPVTNVIDSVNTLSYRSRTVIMAIPDRVEELRDWADTHPGGKLVMQEDCGMVLLAAYEIP